MWHQHEILREYYSTSVLEMQVYLGTLFFIICLCRTRGRTRAMREVKSERRTTFAKDGMLSTKQRLEWHDW